MINMNEVIKMKRNIIIMATALMLAMLVFAGCAANSEIMQDSSEAADEAIAEDVLGSEDMQTEQEDGFGALAALEKDGLTIEQMLVYAIQDEYMARQEYESIMDEFGEQRPFSNIINAEVTHIQWLKELFDKYGYSIPEDTAAQYVVLPASIEEAMEVGVQAEINNIAMYEKFMEEDLPDDIMDVFIELRDASQNHLAAFEKGPRGGGNGAGSGGQQN